MKIKKPKLFDTVGFIMTVERYPCLWGLKSSFREKQQAWDAVAREFKPDYNKLDDKQKKEHVNLLKKKWKNIRHCFRTEFKQQTSTDISESDTAKARVQYKYYNQLSFLIPFMNYDGHESESNTSNAQGKSCTNEDFPDFRKFESVNVEDFSTDKKQYPKTRSKSSKFVKTQAQFSQNDDMRDKFYTTLQENITLKQMQTYSFDEDKMFLLSLLKDFKRIPENMKLRFKAEFLNNLSQLVERYTQDVNQATNSALSLAL